MIDIGPIKEKILRLAFEGKLTERLPSDSNVDLIIERCKIDKDESIKKGKAKKESFRGDIENPLYTIPQEWRWLYISDMSLFQEGPGILAVVFRKNGVPLIRISGMDGQAVSLNGCNYLDPEMVNEKWNHFRLDAGDILISSSASLDRISEVDEVAEGAIPYTGLIRFKMYGGISKDYFKWFIQSPFYIEQVNKQKQGGFISHYGPTHLRKMMIPIPSIEEQKRIVDRINAVYEMINQIEILKHQYESDREILRGKIIDAGIRGKLTEQLPEDGNAEELYAQIQTEKAKLIKEGNIKKEKPLPEISDDEIPFKIPDNWKWVHLNDIGSWSAGATPSRSNREYYRNGTIPWVKTGELKDGYISDVEEYITEKAFNECSVRLNPPGSVLIAMYGATIGKVGILEIDATTNQACCACIPILIDNRFLFYFLKRNKENFINASHGGAQPNISKEIITQSVMPLPPLGEQKRIVEKIQGILSVLE